MKYMDLDVTHKRSMNVDRNRHDFEGFCEKFTYLKNIWGKSIDISVKNIFKYGENNHNLRFTC